MLGGVIHSKGDGTQKRRHFEQEVALRLSEPGAMELIAFASARSKRYPQDEGMKGNHLIIPPGASLPGASPWLGKQWQEDSLSGDFGHLDLRHKEKAVVARLDGSVQLMEAKQLRDMRNWSLGAKENNDPGYSVSSR
jgi:hypothetical protein